MIISGGLAGLGGAVLVLFANRYQEGQTGGRGFLGLATLVVGNWRPAGVAFGAALFGYFQGITLRTDPEQLVLALLLVASIGLFVAAALAIVRQPVDPGGRLRDPRRRVRLDLPDRRPIRTTSSSTSRRTS